MIYRLGIKRKTQFLTVLALLLSFLVAYICPHQAHALSKDKLAPIPTHKPEVPVYMQRPSYLSQGHRDPLSRADIRIYRVIYALQKSGKMKKADPYYAQLKDTRLLGHMLYQRYMHPHYRSRFPELQTWLEYYNDHPNADRIYSLAQRKKPSYFSGSLKKPQKAREITRVAEPTMQAAQIYKSNKKRGRLNRAKAAKIKKDVRYKIKTSQITRAVNKIAALEKEGFLDHVEIDELNGRLSSSYLYGGYLPEAKETSQAAVQRSGAHVPEAAWVAGLVAWKESDFQNSAHYFELAAGSPYASGWQRAAAAYWAARAHMRGGNARHISRWLRQAAAHPRTFYGLLAIRALGQDFVFNWNVPKFTEQDYRVLAGLNAGLRAVALVDIGLPELAQAELMRLNPKDPAVQNAMLSYAEEASLPALSMRIGGLLSLRHEVSYDSALYPVGHWIPTDKQKVSSDLIHAIIRQESRFDTNAKSVSGARGLMQIMPITAQHVSRKAKMGKLPKGALHDPDINLSLGQFYIHELLNHKAVRGDLTALLVAYNAGPGNLQRWQKRWPDVDDSLLFIELLPSSQTRQYVEKVLANFWIYRMRAGHETYTLSALSAGQNALYSQIFQKPKSRMAYFGLRSGERGYNP